MTRRTLSGVAALVGALLSTAQGSAVSARLARQGTRPAAITT
jgi:hypothetical protein